MASATVECILARNMVLTTRSEYLCLSGGGAGLSVSLRFHTDCSTVRCPRHYCRKLSNSLLKSVTHRNSCAPFLNSLAGQDINTAAVEDADATAAVRALSDHDDSPFNEPYGDR